jgi:hypothetical protein
MAVIYHPSRAALPIDEGFDAGVLQGFDSTKVLRLSSST